MAAAKLKIAARAEERYQREKAEYDEKMARRAARDKDRGKKPAGKAPRYPNPGPGRAIRSISPTKNRASCLLLAAALSKPTTLRPQRTPRRCWWLPRGSRRRPMTRNRFETQSPVLGTVERMIADAGFCSEKEYPGV
jgi:hypothetical protein